MLKKITLQPGLNRDGTNYSAEGSWYDADKVRFRQGRPEKIGGWQRISDATFDGVCRALHNWASLNADDYMAIGTNSKVYIEFGSVYYDITPSRYAYVGTLASDVSAVATTVNVAAGTGGNFPRYDAIKIDNEFMYITSISTDALTVDRGNDTFGNNDMKTTHSASTAGGALPAVVNLIPRMAPAFESGKGVFGIVNGSSTVLCRMDNHGSYMGDYFHVLQTGETFSNGITQADLVVSDGLKVSKRLDANNFETTVGGTGTTTNTTLSEDLDAGATTVKVASSSGFSASDYIKIESEYIKIGTVGTNEFTSCTRAQFGSTDVMHGGDDELPAVAKVELVSITGANADVSNYLLFDRISGAATSSGSTGWGWADWGDGTWGEPGTFTTSDTMRIWSMDNYGQDLVLSIKDGPIYYWAKNARTSSAGNTSSIAGSIPMRTGAASTTKASRCIVNCPNSQAVPLKDIGNSDSDGDGYIPDKSVMTLVHPDLRMIVAFGASEIDTGGSAPSYSGDQNMMLVRNSSIDLPYAFQPTATNTSDGNPLTTGSYIVSAARSKREIIIWTDDAVYVMAVDPSGGADGLTPFSYTEVATNVSIVGPSAYAVSGNVVYWMGDRNFYMYDGSLSIVPCSVLSYVFRDLNYSGRLKTFGASNSEFNEVTWFYPSSDSSEIDRYVSFNTLDSVWSIGSLQRTAWSDSGIRSNPYASFVVDAGAGTSRLYAHEIGGDDDGSAMTAYIESGYFDIDDGDHFSFVHRLIPDAKITAFNSENVPIVPGVDQTLVMALRQKSYPNDSEESSPVSSTVNSTTTQANIRVRGRQLAFKVSSTAAGYIWRLGDTRIDVKPDGRA